MLGWVAALTLVLWPAGARAQESEWEWATPLPQGNRFEDVRDRSASDVFAVGDSNILHYSGPAPDVEEPEDETPVVPEGSPLLLLGLGGAARVAYFGHQAWTRRRAGMGQKWLRSPDSPR